jgi:hypothetical protein
MTRRQCQLAVVCAQYHRLPTDETVLDMLR